MGSFSGPKVEQNSLYNYHICTSSGTFTPSFTGNIEVLVVAGGGGGGMDMGGGGGGGGVLTSTTYAVTAATGITVTVGAGGVGAPSGGTNGQTNDHQFTIAATQGGNSVFGSLTAIGGGFGGSSYRAYTPGIAGGAGGSGGGSSGYNDTAGTFLGGAGTAGQGFRGGNSTAAYFSGGGGGAGAQGVDATAQPNGGAGILNAILGVNYYWSGGGGGASYSLATGGNGGLGGGGGGALGFTTGGAGLNAGDPGGGGYAGTQAQCHGGNAGQNTGGGGGGGSHYNRSNYGGNGGSGIVIIRYFKTLGTSTFSNSGPVDINSLVLSFDAANTKKSSVVEVLVVAGGAGGGNDMGGGGGAGGVVYNNAYSVITNEPISVTIGAGGAGATGYANNPLAGASGGNTIFGKILAYGGGGGGSGHYFTAPTAGQQGQSGGSGGGDSPLWGRNRKFGNALGFKGQGYDGGLSQTVDGNYKAGGGGGASQPGGGGGNTYSGNGGQGFLSAINGTSYSWGGGGGGAHHESVGGNGGAGGGGGGSGWSAGTAGTGGAGLNAGGNGVNNTTSSVGGAGGVNTGGGGGGGGHQSTGGAGGSGIVIVRYYGSQKATGGTITSAGEYTIHTFTSSGTFTPTGFLDIGDTFGNGLKGVVNGSTYSSDNGGALVFNGSSNSVTIPFNSSLFTFDNEQTIIIWMKNQSPSSARRNPYDQAYAGAGTITHENDTHFNYFYGTGGGNNAPYVNLGTAFSVVVGETAMICFTRNTSTVSCYKNGIFSNSMVNPFGSVVTGTNNITLGAGYAGYFGGNLYNVQLYNRALSAAEVLQNFNVLRGRFNI